MFKLAEPVGNLLDEGFEAVWFKKALQMDKGQGKPHLKSARIANILRYVREPVPCISIYMDTKSFMIHGIFWFM